MLTEIEAFRVCDGYRIEVHFRDGVEAVVDLSDLVGRGVLGPLRDPAQFARATLDELGALSWRSGTDLAPDAMHDALRRDGLWRPALANSALPA